MALSEQEERDLGLQVDRKSLAPAAREPEEDARDLGFGSEYEGPLEQRPHAPLLNSRKAEKPEDASGSWRSEAERDIRRECPPLPAVPPRDS
jgi:hypothetical protein